ncbi:NAD(P)H-dependent oxidoreductase [Bradyrhizobium sp. S3.9.1]|uniref:NADPH-dependent FMN reductase n=1 Tax=Bradyrhizobium sp. S3.9.1 TaxID=3156431 RepID=UPI003395E3D4
MSTVPTRLIGLPGSLREASFSRATLAGLRDNLPASAGLEIVSPRLPLYNEDEDGDNAPEEVRHFRDAIASSAGLIIATPEYNHGIPGVLKNALDWASRPYGKSALIEKPVLVISVSPAFTGGARAHAQVNETLLSIPACLAAGPQVVIGSIAEKLSMGALDQSFALQSVHRLIALSRKHPL